MGPDGRTPHDATRKGRASSAGFARIASPFLLLLRRFKTALWFVGGILALLIGFAGLVLPAVPGVVFLIMAAACFARSSPRFERWLVEHAHLGPPIRRWRDTGSIPRRLKYLAVASMAVSLTGITLFAPPIAALVCGAGMAAAAYYVMTRPDA